MGIFGGRAALACVGFAIDDAAVAIYMVAVHVSVIVIGAVRSVYTYTSACACFIYRSSSANHLSTQSYKPDFRVSHLCESSL